MSEIMVRENHAQEQVNDLMVYAQRAVSSKLVPKGIDTPEKALIVMLKGRELGLKPMQALNHIYVVNGSAAVDTKVLASLFTKRGNKFFPIESTAEKCTVKFTNRDGDVFTFTMTMAECKQAKWNQTWDYESKSYKDKPTWLAMPATMLWYRTLSTGIRRVDPGALLDNLTEDEILDTRAPVEAAEMQTIDCEAELVEDEAAVAAEQEGSESGIQAPEPNAGWDKWGDIKQRGFWGRMKKAGLSEEQVHAEFGVASMKEWLYSIEQTRPLLELLEFSPDITIVEKKRILGVERLAEIVQYGWSYADIKAAISETIGAAK